MIKIKVIGMGGIGSYLIEPLARYLSFSKDPCELTMIDGDVYEEKNRDRQKFSKYENKAMETFDQISKEFPKIHFKFKPEYITESNVISAIREKDVLFLCVDNHATRKLVSNRCSDLNDVTLISGGNDHVDGNVICYLRKNGKDITRSLVDLHPEIANPTDENPGNTNSSKKDGCQIEVETNPQLLFTNLAIASTMLNCYRRCELNNVDFHQIYVDINLMKSRTSPNTI